MTPKSSDKGDMTVANELRTSVESGPGKKESQTMEELADRVGHVLFACRKQMLELPEDFAKICREHGKHKWIDRLTPGWRRTELAELTAFLAKEKLIDEPLSYIKIWRIETGDSPRNQSLRLYAELLGFELPSKAALGKALKQKREDMMELRSPLQEWAQERGFCGRYLERKVQGWKRKEIVDLTFDLINSELTRRELPISQVLSIPVISRLENGKNYSSSALRTYAYVLDADDLVTFTDDQSEEPNYGK